MIVYLLMWIGLLNGTMAQEPIDWCAELAHLPPNTAHIIMDGTYTHSKQVSTDIGYARSPDNPITFEQGGYTLSAGTMTTLPGTTERFTSQTSLLTQHVPPTFAGMLLVPSREEAFGDNTIIFPNVIPFIRITTDGDRFGVAFYLNHSGWAYLEAMDDVYYRAAFDFTLESNRGEPLHVQGVLHLAYDSIPNLRIEGLLRRLGRIELLGICDPQGVVNYTLD